MKPALVPGSYNPDVGTPPNLADRGDRPEDVEAEEVAKAIRHLQHLTYLTLRVSYSITTSESTSWLLESPNRVSPLILFLEAPFSQGYNQPGNSVPTGLNRLLKLVLSDRVRSKLQ